MLTQDNIQSYSISDQFMNWPLVKPNKSLVEPNKSTNNPVCLQSIKNHQIHISDNTWNNQCFHIDGNLDPSKTPFDERDETLSSEEKVARMIEEASHDSRLPFRKSLIKDLQSVTEPDPFGDEEPLALEALSQFLRFMKQADWLTEPPRLSGGVNGGLCAGWKRSKSHYLFVYFMRAGVIQFVAEHPDTSYISGRLPKPVLASRTMAQLASAYNLFCSGDQHAS
ncbi:MAG: hypothetical protein HQL95_08905 [Magnetococcales bacterium]|nr:hypothetical protein [Magnetococcales bacterium]